MRGMSASELLDAWEDGTAVRPGERALRLAVVADGAEATALSVGERDARLLELRALTFGDRLEALAECPDCAEPVEISTSIAELVAGGAESRPGAAPLELRWRDWRVSFRVPTAGDLALAAETGDSAGARRILLERCVTAASRGGRAMRASSIPAAVVDLMGRRIAEADSGAELLLALECPLCGCEWEAPFDVTGVIWTELEAAALRIIDEVDRLARAYGWREADVLALSAARRRAYLELVS